MISNEIRLLIPKIQSYLSGQPVKRAWLFGSCSRGEEQPGSDIDILVQYAEGERVTLLTISRIATALGKLLKRTVDLVEDDCLLPFAAGNASGEKILIYDKDNSLAKRYHSIEICAGAGGQALGLEMAGFCHTTLVEYEKDYCECLKRNRPQWDIQCLDVHHFDGKPYRGQIDLLAGGVPCPPFSVAGKQLGADDERDLFPQMLRLVHEINPRAVMIENVRGLLDPKFDAYRKGILERLEHLGYRPHIQLLNASDYGVPQLRPRVVIVGLRKDLTDIFTFPGKQPEKTPTVGETLFDLMAANGWEQAAEWKQKADRIAPTLVGGSKKHGGPDLGPTRARKAWAELGVDGRGVANEAPAPDFEGMPRLTPRMLARLQGFPDDWDFGKRKTTACRMIGNAFPPPVAMNIGLQIKKVLDYEQCTHSRSKKEVSSRAAV